MFYPKAKLTKMAIKVEVEKKNHIHTRQNTEDSVVERKTRILPEGKDKRHLILCWSTFNTYSLFGESMGMFFLVYLVVICM